MIPPQSRALRGGSWINNGRNLRAANRNANQPGNRDNNAGFRFLLSSPRWAASSGRMARQTSCPGVDAPFRDQPLPRLPPIGARPIARPPWRG